jgi:phosphate starvation-inducible PhoH-like protein
MTDKNGSAPHHLLRFDDNTVLPLLFGEHNQNLARLEKILEVRISTRGNRVSITGDREAADAAKVALFALYERTKKGAALTDAEVDAAARMALETSSGNSDAPKDMDAPHLTIRTRKRQVRARSVNQAKYAESLDRHELIFAIGPAGTGKTYLAVAKAVELLLAGQIDRIILSRPAVEAGERLGYLPGDLQEKVDPYLRPLYDALYDMMPAEQVATRLGSGEIEVAPLAFMRGRTLSNAFVILDEAQNTTPVQMKMFLTRLGENSRMAVTGDLSQVDLPKGQPSGLAEAVELIGNMPEVSCVRFDNNDVMRHSLVTRILRAYDERECRAARGESVRKEAHGGPGEGEPKGATVGGGEELG